MVLRNLLKNWPYKLIALGTAIILTTYVHGERNPTVSTSAATRLGIIGLQKGYVVTLAQEEVPISLQGPKTAVDAVKPTDIKAWINLANLRAGSHTVPIIVSFPESSTHNVIAKPAVPKVSVTIEALSSRTLPVEVKIKNSPPIGYASSEPSVTPSVATVSGRRSLVDSVARLIVMVDPTPLRPSLDEYVSIKPVDSHDNPVNDVNISPDGVRVALRLVETPADKPIFVSPTIVGQPQFPYRVTKVNVTPNSVSVKGRPESLAGASTVSTDAVDIAGATTDVVRQVGLHVPPGLDIDGPRTVKVTVRIVPSPPGSADR